MALGLSVIFGVIRIVNFAHGEMMVAGMYVAIVLNARWGVDPVAGAAGGGGAAVRGRLSRCSAA